MLKMSTIGQNAGVQTIAKVVDSLSVASHPRSAAFVMSTNMLDMT